MSGRWSGIFETPNQAALLVAVGLVSAAAIVAALSPGARSTRRTTAWILLMAVQAGLAYLIARTGSRAGCAACVSGLLVLLLVAPRAWRTVVPAVILVIGAFLVLPESGTRLPVTASELAHGDRAVLWRATLAVSVDHPWTGVGTHAASLLEDWYLPDGYAKRFQTSLNDGLTILVRFGYPAFLAVLALVALLAAAAISDRSLWSGWLLGVACVHLVAGLFQAHLWYLPTLLSFVLTMSLLALAVRKRIRPGHLVAASAIATATTGLLVITARLVASGFPWATELVDDDGVRAFPRGHRNSPTILCQLADREAVRRFRHATLRDHPPTGYAVICRGPADGGTTARWDHVSAWHQVAADRWSDARSDAHGDRLYLVNPHGTPGTPGNGGARLSLVVTAHAPFVPDAADLAESSAQDGPQSSLAVYPAKASEWTSLVETIRKSEMKDGR